MKLHTTLDTTVGGKNHQAIAGPKLNETKTNNIKALITKLKFTAAQEGESFHQNIQNWLKNDNPNEFHP